jgi:NADH dehydrogenase FAD-containing subunit
MESADSYIKEELERRGVRVEYGMNLTEINQEK